MFYFYEGGPAIEEEEQMIDYVKQVMNDRLCCIFNLCRTNLGT